MLSVLSLKHEDLKKVYQRKIRQTRFPIKLKYSAVQGFVKLFGEAARTGYPVKLVSLLHSFR
jgi:hypothetical protein